MERARTIFSCSLGGAIWGSLLGIVAGALCGSAYGAAVGDVSLGLDGAIWCGPLAAAAGAAYGLFLGWHGSAGAEAPPPTRPAPSEMLHSSSKER